MKKAEKERKKKELEKKKKEAEAKGEKFEEEEEEKEEEEKPEDKEESEEEEKEDEPMNEAEEDPPKVELDADEKKQIFRTPPVPDLPPNILNKIFAKFTLPDKSEGFEDIQYEWGSEKKASEYIKKWITDRKLSTPVEDIKPGQWFKTKWAAKSKPTLAVKEKEKEKGDDETEKEKEDEEEDENGAEAEKENENLDVFGVDDVNNSCGGAPLYKDFAAEDWALLSLKVEMYLLTQAFGHDVDDPERVGIHESHVNFYYSRYFSKAIDLGFYGCSNLKELVKLVDDTIALSPKLAGVIESLVPGDMESFDIFLKLTCKRSSLPRSTSTVLWTSTSPLMAPSN